MAVFSRMMGSSCGSWQQTPAEQQGEIKFCVLGLMLTTDSPKLLLLSVTCGILSISLLSSASRALLAALWNKSRKWLLNFLRESPPDKALVPVNKNIIMGQLNGTIRTVHLDTCNGSSDVDLCASYEIIDLPRIKPRMKDGGTSPMRRGSLLCDVGVGDWDAGCSTQDRACSPFPFVSGSPCPFAESTEELFAFEKELNEGSLVNLEEESTQGELYEKLAFIQKAVQETSQEMDHTMSSLSELSQRHCCSSSATSQISPRNRFAPLHPTYNMSSCRVLDALHPLVMSSLDPANGLVWEDEFDERSPVNPELALWESELRFYSGLCGKPQVELLDDSLSYFDPMSSSYTLDSSAETSRTARDSGVVDLWDMDDPENGEPVEEKSPVIKENICSVCAGHLEKGSEAKRPVSAPSCTGSGDSEASSGKACLSSDCSPLHVSTDRVPKQRKK